MSSFRRSVSALFVLVVAAAMGLSFTRHASASSYRVLERASSGAQFWLALGGSDDGLKLAIGGAGTAVWTSEDGGATWTERTGSGSRFWTAIAYSGDGTTILAADGSNGYLYTSDDAGVTWDERTDSGQHSWNAVSVSYDGTVMAAAAGGGAGNFLYRSGDSGANWDVLTDAGQRGWNAVLVARDGGDLVATGVDTTTGESSLSRSTDDGATWTDTFVTTDHIWTSIAGSGDLAHVFGFQRDNSTGAGYLYDITGGLTTSTALTAAGERSWSRVVSSADGTHLAADAGATTYFSDDAGASWTLVPQLSGHQWQAIATSENGARRAFVAASENLFTAERIADPVISSLDSNQPVFYHAARITWMTDVPADAQVAFGLTEDLGQVSQLEDTGDDLATAHDLLIAGLQRCSTYYFEALSSNGVGEPVSEAGAFQTGGCEDPEMKSLYDWDEVGPPALHSWSDTASSDDGSRLYAAASDGVWYSRDAGSTWYELAALPAAASWSSVDTIANGDTVVVAGDAADGEVFLCTWNSGEATFDCAASAGAGERAWSAVSVSADGTRLAAVGSDTGGARAWTSADSGATWTEQPASPLGDWVSLAASDDGMVLAAGVDTDAERFFLSVDGGVTWTDEALPTGTSWSSAAISADGQSIIAAAHNLPLRRSADGGATWTADTLFAGQSWKALACADECAVTAFATVVEEGVGSIFTTGQSASAVTERDAGTYPWSDLAYDSAGSQLLAATETGFLYRGTYAPPYVFEISELGLTFDEDGGATVTWVTDQPGTTEISFTRQDEDADTISFSDGDLVTEHAVHFSAGTFPTCATYGYEAISFDESENLASSGELAADTPCAEPEPDPEDDAAPETSSRSRGAHRRFGPALLQDPVPDQLRQLLGDNLSLLTGAHARGIALPAFIIDFLGVAASSSAVPQPTLSFGDAGAGVLGLQQLLVQRALGPAAHALAENGLTRYFGPLTRAALAELQAAVGIAPASGIYGPLTAAYLRTHP